MVKRSLRTARIRRVVVTLSLLFVVSVLVVVGAIVGLFYYYSRDIDLKKLSTVADYRPHTITRIYDRHGTVVGEIGDQRRTVVPYGRIPRQLIQAVVAAEDADFFQHRGLDYRGLVRAMWVNLRSGRFSQGGSTITQQVVKNILLTHQKTAERKFKEFLLARRIELVLSKDEIMNLYLQQIYFGHGRYGVQEASRFFFGKDVDQLNLAQVALLAGLPQSPERLSPYRHPERAKQRQRYVLREMVRHGYLPVAEARRISDEPIRVVRQQQLRRNIAPEVVDLVRKQLSRAYGTDQLSQLGLQVHTTIDATLQAAAKDALQWGLRELDARHGYRGAMGHLKPEEVDGKLKRLRRSQRALSSQSAYGVYQGVVTKIDDAQQLLALDLGVKQIAVSTAEPRYNPEQQPASQRFSIGDVVRVQFDPDGFALLGGPQGALLALDPKTGDVLSMVGGYDLVPGDFNRAIDAVRQPGSAFKPFVYAAALDSGRFTAASIIEDAPLSFNGWEPKNYDGQYRGPMRLRSALAQSVNTVAVKLLQDVGIDPVRRLATALGIATPLTNDLTLALGSSAVRVTDLAAAYCAFVNGGKAIEPRFIDRVGKTAFEKTTATQVLRPEVASLMALMLQSVITEGTGYRAAALGRPLIGKTGTTNQQRDIWFIGATPQLLTVVWVGFDLNVSLGKKETGGRSAIPIWVRFMKQALIGKPRVSFEPTAGITMQRIDPETGLLAHPGAIEAIDEYFIAGTEPKSVAAPPPAL